MNTAPQPFARRQLKNDLPREPFLLISYVSSTTWPKHMLPPMLHFICGESHDGISLVAFFDWEVSTQPSRPRPGNTPRRSSMHAVWLVTPSQDVICGSLTSSSSDPGTLFRCLPFPRRISRCSCATWVQHQLVTRHTTSMRDHCDICDVELAWRLRAEALRESLFKQR